MGTKYDFELRYLKNQLAHENHENGGALMGRKYDFELRYLKKQLAHEGQ